MPKPITHVLAIVDMSGSMAVLADRVREGFNGYVAALREDRASKYRMTLTLFNTDVSYACSHAKLAHVPALTEDTYRPRGNTALLDAVGSTIRRFEATPLGQDDKVLCVINTDGHENSSQEWTWRHVAKLLDEHEATGKWTTVYLGQGFDSWAQGQRFGANTQVVRGLHTNSSVGSTYGGLVTGTQSYAAAPAGQNVDVAAVINTTAGVGPDSPVTEGEAQ